MPVGGPDTAKQFIGTIVDASEKCGNAKIMVFRGIDPKQRITLCVLQGVEA